MYFERKFLKINRTKLKKGIFAKPQIKDDNFETCLTETEFKWLGYNYFGNQKLMNTQEGH